MIKSIVSLVLTVVLLALPTLALARTEVEIQADLAVVESQIAVAQQQKQALLAELNAALGTPSGTLPPLVCTNLLKNIPGVTVTAAEIKQLQTFLVAQGDLAVGTPSGVYNAATIEAVKRFQARNGLAFSGTPETTGYGAVGPGTRGKIRDISCQTNTSTNLRVVSPNGGGTYRQKTDLRIEWSGAGTGKVTIYLMKGRTLARVLAENVNAAANSYTWKIPAGLPSRDDYGIRIVKAENTNLADDSDGIFSIKGIITLTAPNGGQSLTPGQKFTVAWSTEGSLTYTVAAPQVANNPTCQNYDGDGTGYQIVNWVLAPCRSGLANATENVAPKVRILLLKGGSVVATIVGATAATPANSMNGSYDWQVPPGLALGTDYKIRVQDAANASTSDDSDATFTIGFTGGSAPQVNGVTANAVAAPGGSLNLGETLPISWTSQNIANLKVSLYKAGTFLRAIATVASSNISTNWTVPLTGIAGGTDYKIRVESALNSSVYGESDAFAVVAPAVKVISPNGGETMQPGAQNVELKWDVDGTLSGNLVKIFLLKGSTATQIGPAGGISASGEIFRWNVPVGLALGTDYKIRVQDAANASTSDDSDATFTVSYGTGGPAISDVVIGGLASSTIRTGFVAIVTWSAQNAPGFKASLYRSGAPVVANVTPNGAGGNTIPAASRTFNWTIPDSVPAGTGYTIRVMSSANASLYDESDPFEIVAPGIRVTSPAAGAVIQPGTSGIEIKWEIDGTLRGNLVDVFLLKGSSATRITPEGGVSASGGIFRWNVPISQEVRTDYKVRVKQHASGSSIEGESGAFTIGYAANPISVSLDKASVRRGTESVKINWTVANGVTANVRIDLVKPDGTLTAPPVRTSIPAVNGAVGVTYAIPLAMPVGSYKVRVTSIANSSVFAETALAITDATAEATLANLASVLMALEAALQTILGTLGE